MNQQFSVLIDSISYTDKTVSCNISYGVGKGFNTGTLTLTGVEPSLMLHKDVTVIQGDNVFNGFVFSYSKSSNNSFELVLRSNGARLTEPFFLNKNGIANATTALSLCAEYASKAGVTIIYNTEDIDFGGSWVETGTPLMELIKLANVTGADIYDDGTAIVIEPAKYVNGIGINIEPDQILDFANISQDISNNKVGLVITKTNDDIDTQSDQISNGTTVDIVSRDKLYLDVNEQNGEVKIYPTPYVSLDSIQGAKIVRENQYDVVIEKKMFTSEVFMNTDSEILDVKKVLLNGTPITHYNNSGNALFFLTPQNGEITIEYGTKYILAQMEIQATPSGKFAYIEVTKGSQIARWSGFLSDEVSSVEDSFPSSTFGYVIPDGTDYVKGFDVYTFGESANFEMYSGSTEIDPTGLITSTIGSYPQFESVSLVKQSDGSYAVYTKYPINTVTDVTSNGVSIPYSVLVDSNGEKYVSLSQYYPNVEVGYTSNGEKHTIQYPLDTTGETQTLIMFGDQETETFELDLLTPSNEESWYDPSNFPCGYPANFPLNVAQLLGLQIDEIEGIDVPSLSVVDNKGFAYATITQDGIYKYDTSVLKDRTSITVRANSNGSL